MDFQAIVAVENDIEALERLYENDPDGFAAALPEALAALPESALLQEWSARLAEAVEEGSQAGTEVDAQAAGQTDGQADGQAEDKADEQADVQSDDTAAASDQDAPDQADPDQAAPDQADPDQAETDQADSGMPTLDMPAPEPAPEPEPAPQPAPSKPSKPAKPAKPARPKRPARILGPGDATLLDWLILLGLVLLGGAGFCLLDPFSLFFEPNTLFDRNNALVGYALLCVLVLAWRGWPRFMSWACLALFAGAATYANLIPLNTEFQYASPVLGFDNPMTLALLHLGLFFWLVLGACYAKNGPLSLSGWKGFIRFYGEAGVFTMVLLLGMLLVLVLGGMLFGQLRIDWNPNLVYAGLFLLIGLQLGGAWLALRHRGTLFAPTMARYLAPWTALVLAGYLITSLFVGRIWIGPEITGFLQYLTMSLVLGLAMYGVIDKVERPSLVGEVVLVLLLALAIVSSLPVLQDLFHMLGNGLKPLPLALLGGVLAPNVLCAMLLLGLLAKLVGLVSMKKVEAITVFWLPLVGLWWLFMALAMPWIV